MQIFFHMILLQIPVMEDSCDERKYLLTFNQYFPVFSFIGKAVRVLHNLPYIVDTEDEMLVCKYLKAEETNKLDKLHRGVYKLHQTFYFVMQIYSTFMIVKMFGHEYKTLKMFIEQILLILSYFN